MRSTPDGDELQRIYAARFAGITGYRTRVWKVLASYFGQWFPSTGTVLNPLAAAVPLPARASASTGSVPSGLPDWIVLRGTGQLLFSWRVAMLPPCGSRSPGPRNKSHRSIF